MDIDRLIRLHDDTLEKEVDGNAFLRQRLKQRLTSNNGYKERLKPGILKPVLLYAMLFAVCTWLGLMALSGLNKNEPVRPENSSLILLADAMQPNYPGSISRAFQEVME